MATCFAALMCHAPIVVPAVGGAESRRCVRTIRAMVEVAERLVASRPDRLVLISPHAPRDRHRWGAWRGPHVGDLARFRAPEVTVSLPDAPEVAEALGLVSVPTGPLDHGAMVPLAFLWDAGWRGPTAILALPWERGESGAAVGRSLAALDGRTAILASGDMSHRLKEGAPAGFHPQAQHFDDAFVAALRRDDWAGALAAEHRDVAAEDVVDSVRVAMSASGAPLNAEVLAYEGPWGVGYTEAILYDPEPALYSLARRAVERHVRGDPWETPEGGPEGAGVFVTLKAEGRLRGCIGHITPVCDRLFEGVATAARLAATDDPRFEAVTADELDGLHYEVSVLAPPEPIADPSTLDVTRYGVIVNEGARRGLLLPDIEGVDTVEDQLAIARRKGGIAPDAPVQLQRFEVRKHRQPEGAG